MAKGRPIQNDYGMIYRMKEAGHTYRGIAEALQIGESSVGYALKKIRKKEEKRSGDTDNDHD